MVTRDRLLRVLQRTLEWYQDGGYDGVCAALRAANRHSEWTAERQYLKYRFFEYPECHVYVTSWLKLAHPRVVRQAQAVYGFGWPRVYRVAWIKHVMEIIKNGPETYQ